MKLPDATAVEVNPAGSGSGLAFTSGSAVGTALASAIGVLFWQEGRGVNGGVCPEA